MELVYEKVNSFTFTNMGAAKEPFDKTFCGAKCLFVESHDAQALGWRQRTQKETDFWWRQGGPQPRGAPGGPDEIAAAGRAAAAGDARGPWRRTS